MKTIYLIKSESPSGDLSYKIGITGRDPYDRLDELQTGSPNTLVIMYTFKSKYGNLLESTLHKHFNINNIRGEWFELNQEEIKNFPNICYKIENNLKILHEENTYFQNKNKIK
jgi:hypothetical protein